MAAVDVEEADEGADEEEEDEEDDDGAMDGNGGDAQGDAVAAAAFNRLENSCWELGLLDNESCADTDDDDKDGAVDKPRISCNFCNEDMGEMRVWTGYKHERPKNAAGRSETETARRNFNRHFDA